MLETRKRIERTLELGVELHLESASGVEQQSCHLAVEGQNI